MSWILNEVNSFDAFQLSNFNVRSSTSNNTTDYSSALDLSHNPLEVHSKQPQYLLRHVSR